MKKRPVWIQDLFFLYKYGFVYIYLIFIICYIVLLQAVSPSYRDITMIFLVYTDPAAMGLFFMGAIVLLEKSQRVQNALAVSPLSVSSYIVGKMTAFLIPGEVVAMCIAISNRYEHLLGVFVGVALGSLLYSAFGLIVADYAKSLNQFMVMSVLVELILTVPGVLHIIGLKHTLLTINPGVMVVELMEGSNSQPQIIVAVLILEVVLLFLACNEVTKRSFQKLGGMKL